ncbi:hypothetical protein J421_4746 (plasmid) [Gemmatirosa kalamazoonensis]|uniref:Uncharacterized protein n=1 Tax=Gemmatirosa kalamazoonensis TaxID=861299 RepID=W0RNG5_9BACT|nr:hypothetical protein [Gemmatirosa kalamazoonensis]AHG92281.1 hypothetical protein J421_4746 [Gemmatirosa kalamazoonensis]
MPKVCVTLRVTITGLAVYVPHEDYLQVAVLFPDARHRADEAEWKRWSEHPDKSHGVPHACYLRVDLANLALAGGTRVAAGSISRDGEGRPVWEVLYELDHAFVDFGFPVSKASRTDGRPVINAPYTDDYAPDLKLIDDLLHQTVTSSPAKEKLICRTVLQEGTLEPSTSKEKWLIAGTLKNKPQEVVVFDQSGYRNWVRTLEVDVPDGEQPIITLMIRNFDGTLRQSVPLRPVGGEINVRIANLCANNPLEWESLKVHTSPTEDLDFKWLYHLFEPRTGSWDDLLAGNLLPVPQCIRTRTGDPDDCGPTGVSGKFTIDAYDAYAPASGPSEGPNASRHPA